VPAPRTRCLPPRPGSPQLLVRASEQGPAGEGAHAAPRRLPEAHPPEEDEDDVRVRGQGRGRGRGDGVGG